MNTLPENKLPKLLVPREFIDSDDFINSFKNKYLTYILCDDAEVAFDNDINLPQNNLKASRSYLSAIQFDAVILTKDFLESQEDECYIRTGKEFITEFIKPKLKDKGELRIKLSINSKYRDIILHEIDTYCQLHSVSYDYSDICLYCEKLPKQVVEFFRGFHCTYTKFYLEQNPQIYYFTDAHFGRPQRTSFRGTFFLSGELNLTIPLFTFDFLIKAFANNCKIEEIASEQITRFGYYFSDKLKEDNEDYDLYETDTYDNFIKKNEYGLLIKDDYFSWEFTEIEKNVYRYSSQPLSNLNLDSKIKYAFLNPGRYIVINNMNEVAAFTVSTTLFLPESKVNNYLFFKAQDDCIKSSDELIIWACLIAKYLKELNLSPIVHIKPVQNDISKILLNMMYPKSKLNHLKNKFKLKYAKENFDDYLELKETLDKLKHKKWISQEYDRYYWTTTSEQSLKKISTDKQKLEDFPCTKELSTQKLWLGFIYEILLGKTNKSERHNECIVEKMLPCNGKISNLTKETKNKLKEEKIKEKTYEEIFSALLKI